MNRLFPIFHARPVLTALSAILCLAQLPSQAEDFTYVTIPSIITGLPVTSIGEQAFSFRKGP